MFLILMLISELSKVSQAFVFIENFAKFIASFKWRNEENDVKM